MPTAVSSLSSRSYVTPPYSRCTNVASPVSLNFWSAALAASASLLATTTPNVGLSCARSVAQTPASSPSHGAKSFSQVRPSPSSASASSIFCRIQPAGSSVRKSLPAAASASSRRAPSGCTTDCAYTGAPAGTSDAGSASPPEDDDDAPQAAATVASATQMNESAVARSMRSSPFEVPVQFPPTSSGGRDDTA